MRASLGICIVAGLTSVAAMCAGNAGGGGPSSGSGATPERARSKAMSLEAAQGGFREPRVSMLKSLPPQFVVHLVREMPTPGWTIDVDGVDVDRETGRIVVRATEQQPDGIVAQVITPTELRVELGTLDPGRYLLECRLRRGAGSDYVLADAMVLVAR